MFGPGCGRGSGLGVGDDLFLVCFRPWRRGIKTDNQNHGGQGCLFQREDTNPRCKGDSDHQRDQGGGQTGQSESHPLDLWPVFIFHQLLNRCEFHVQEQIVEKVKEGLLVRAKIFQSSAQRHKRGQIPENHRPGLNNNIPSSQTQKNGLIHAKRTRAQPEELTEELREELTSTHTDDGREEEEEESVSTDSLSEVSKFESKRMLQKVEGFSQVSSSDL